MNLIEPCSVEDCDRPLYAKTYCHTHSQRLVRHGDIHYADELQRVRPRGSASALWRENVGYSGIHSKLKSIRGRARNYACVDCGKQALDWTLPWDLPLDEYGNTPYVWDGLRVLVHDIEAYEPRCRSDHKLMDIAHRKQQLAWMA